MLKIKKITIVLFFFSTAIFAQKSVNDYKYVIVPSHFGFQKNAGDFQLNELTKFLFNKHGFTALLSTDVFPDDLAQNRCLALTAHLRKTSSLMKSKLKYDLVNCNNQVVFTTNYASSKEKDYKKAYQEGARKAFNDIRSLNYKYKPKVVDEVVAETKNKEGDILEVTTKKEVVEQKPIFEKKDYVVKKDVKVVEASNTNLLYAQPINNGFQLVDNTPKKIYVIKKTTVKDIFILEDLNGILYKSNNQWIVEYYADNKLVKKEVNIKF